jgi:hypothetical protein
MVFETIEAARRALDRLRWSHALIIHHLCQEDQIVLRSDGFYPQPWTDGWRVRRCVS